MWVQSPNPDRNMKIHRKFGLMVHILHKLKSKTWSFSLLVEEGKWIYKTYNASHSMIFSSCVVITVPRISFYKQAIKIKEAQAKRFKFQ